MGEPKPVNFRHELKYLISSAEVTMLRIRLSGLISLDAHAKNGHYTIRSLYFDETMTTAVFWKTKTAPIPERNSASAFITAAPDRIIGMQAQGARMTHTSCPLTRGADGASDGGKDSAQCGRPAAPSPKAHGADDDPPPAPRGHRGIRAHSLRLQKNGNVRITLDTNLVSSSDVSPAPA